MYYLQGQLRWLARWKETGRVDGSPPKGIFYLLWLFPGVIAILAAIAIPAYQDYILRAQVAEGFIVARQAETAVAAYYADHGEMPQDNAAAGIGEAASMSGRYVSAVDVEAGKLVVAYDTPQANRILRSQVLVLVPYRDAQGRVQWNCNNPDTTIQLRYLPLACRS
jgi:Tfp pilus assembly protein PilE